jgi:hypothetical protein
MILVRYSGMHYVIAVRERLENEPNVRQLPVESLGFPDPRPAPRTQGSRMTSVRLSASV